MPDTAHVRATCSSCGALLPPSHNGPCPSCGKEGKNIVGVVNETIEINESLARIRKRESVRKNYKYFWLTLATTSVSPFIASFFNAVVGIIVGLAFGFLSFYLGKRAWEYTKEIERDTVSYHHA